MIDADHGISGPEILLNFTPMEMNCVTLPVKQRAGASAAI
jgi:hypothetical protein